MSKQVPLLAGLSLVAVFVVGCAQEQLPPGTQVPTAQTEQPTADGAKYVLTTEPDGAKDVIEVREAAGDNDEVVIVGRIGGDMNPWVDGRAAFKIVDPSLKACSDIPGDACPKPWDYCCETDKLPEATALVKVVDESGDVVAADARELLNVTELQTVVVRGTAKRDDAGNLTVLAKGVFLRK